MFSGGDYDEVARWVWNFAESHAKRDEVHRLAAEHARLDARRRALGDPRTLEAEARKLGMVGPTERAFVVKGLPTH